MRRRGLGSSQSEHEKGAFRHFASARKIAEKGRGDSCNEAYRSLVASALQQGQGIAEFRSAGEPHDLGLRALKKAASEALVDLDHDFMQRCILRRKW